MQLETSQVEDCLVCGGNSFTKLLSSDKFKMGLCTDICDDCGIVFTNPMPSEKYLDYFYKKVYRKFYTTYSVPSETYIKNLGRDKRAAYHASFLHRAGYLGELERYIDVGAAEGSFLKALKDLRLGGSREFIGVEPSIPFSDFALRAGFYDRHVDNIHELEIGRGSALISMIHVLEHIHQPKEFLVQLKDSLGPKGLLYIDVPNIVEYNSIAEIHIAHLYHFDVDSLRNLLVQAGYEILVIEAHEPPHHPRSLRAVATPLALREDLKASIIFNTDERSLVIKTTFTRVEGSLKNYFSMKAVCRRFLKRVLGPVKRAFS